ncbi:alcohol dehydrogenase catalytic domain-containing protein [Streptomyces sp. NPDC007971]|uniref:alcohol dehydrogenase catalytic domain-containing protein n=1 Tax=Streptomyces sp. NPDC007971 TaxID=3364799 RepID=UPI0036E008BA
MRAVRFDRYGGREVLYLADVAGPAAGPGQVRVKVKAAGINPGEAAIRSGAPAERFPATFPSGQGNDFAGVVAEPAPRCSAGRGTGRATPSTSSCPRPRWCQARARPGGGRVAVRRGCHRVRRHESGRRERGRGGGRLGRSRRSALPPRASRGGC